MNSFRQEFNTFSYIIEHAKNILLFAHSGPDADTVGSVLALREYFLGLEKKVDVACYDPLPEFIKNLSSVSFLYPDSLDIQSYDVIVACDSVERGFDKIYSQISEKQVVVLIDHHPDITLKGDVVMIDPAYSSVCEIIDNYLEFIKAPITKQIATYLMVGILGDTGSFQHANTTTKVIEIASDLMKKGASLPKIINLAFTNKKLATLKLWGRAFEKAKINSKNGMIATVLTQSDVEECNASTEDIAQVASILNTVPGSKFSLILSERGDGIVKGSLRSEEYKGVDVSKIAHEFGGGGHKLASGFEVKGKIVETASGWKIV